jgi:hypothetical protein
MPAGKRVDMLFACGGMALPVEAKGQWNRDLWTAPGEQLDAFYAQDWRVQRLGLYLVYWFGDGVVAAYKPREAPDGRRVTSAEELREMLVTRISRTRSGMHVCVLDMSRHPGGGGRRKAPQSLLGKEEFHDGARRNPAASQVRRQTAVRRRKRR